MPRRSPSRAPVFVLLLGLLGLLLPGAAASARDTAGEVPARHLRPVIGEAVRHDLSPPLRALARRAGPPSALPTRFARQRLPIPEAPGEAIPRMDPALDRSRPLGTMPEPNLTFEGNSAADQSFLFILPPDPTGEAGPNHYVQAVNVVFSVYTKDGTRILGPLDNTTLWAGLGGPCQRDNDGDPIVQYDQLADRWMISQFAVPGGSQGYHECIAVSATPDPTGPYHRYDFRLSQTVFNDYPKFGVWPDGYYMSINQFTDGFVGPGAVVFERDEMLAGRPARFVYFDQGLDSTLRPQLPADLEGTNPPPPGSPNYFVTSVDGEPDRLGVFRFQVDWSDPEASTFTGPVELPTEAFESSMCVSGDPTRGCIPQMGTPARLDDISDRLMYRLAYRNFGDHESMVVNQTVDTNGLDHAGLRWYELRRSSGDEWGIHQQSTFSPDLALPQGVSAPDPLDHRWMGSIGMDGSGNVALGYSISGAARFPSIAYTGRLAGDEPNTMPQGEVILHAGTGSQHFPIGRWGDYSHIAVDPTDDCTFWLTAEYYTDAPQEGGNLSPWHTRVGSFTFPECGSDLAATMTATPGDVTVGQDVAYTITVTNQGPGASQGVTVTDVIPTTTTLVSATPSQGSCTGTNEVTCSLGTLGIEATATVEVVVTANETGTIDNTATAASVTPDPDPSNNTAGSQVTAA